MKHKLRPFLFALLVCFGSSSARAETCEMFCSQEFWESATIADVEKQLLAEDSIDLTYDEGNTALRLEATHEGSAYIESLLASGANPNAQNYEGFRTLYFAAAFAFFSRITSVSKLTLLLNAGADVNAISHYGFTALHAATIAHDNEAVQLLLDSGADVNVIADDGLTALLLAVVPTERPHFGDRGELIQLLLDAGADVNAEYKGKQSVLHIIAQRSNPYPYSAEEWSDHILLLLNTEVDATLLDEDGNTAFDWLVDQNDLRGTAGYAALKQAVRE